MPQPCTNEIKDGGPQQNQSYRAERIREGTEVREKAEIEAEEVADVALCDKAGYRLAATVMPATAGIQAGRLRGWSVDSRFRGNDELGTQRICRTKVADVFRSYGLTSAESKP